MSHRAPMSAGTVLLSVTRPMTVPSLMTLDLGLWTLDSYRHPRFFFVHNSCDHPSHRTLFVADLLSRCESVRRNDHAMMHPCAMRIKRHLRRAFRIASVIDRLPNNKPPPLEAWMLSSGDYVAFNSC